MSYVLDIIKEYLDGNVKTAGINSPIIMLCPECGYPMNG
jgi:hypothetical protein